MAEESARLRAEFGVRIAVRRRDKSSGRWNSVWRMALDRAVKELGVEVLRINDGLHLRGAEEAAAATSGAEEIAAEMAELRG